MLVLCIAFVAIHSVRAIDATESDWPSANPKDPPSIQTFSTFTVAQLVPLVLGDGEADWRDKSISACAWFMWKTRKGDDGRKQRADLADRIYKTLKKSENKHDLSLLVGYLGMLGGREHIRELLKEVKILDCCYGPALIRGVGECGTKEDISFLIEMIDKESESSGGVTHDALVKITGTNPLPNDHWPYDRQKIKKVWNDWKESHKKEQ